MCVLNASPERLCACAGSSQPCSASEVENNKGMSWGKEGGKFLVTGFPRLQSERREEKQTT